MAVYSDDKNQIGPEAVRLLAMIKDINQVAADMAFAAICQTISFQQALPLIEADRKKQQELTRARAELPPAGFIRFGNTVLNLATIAHIEFPFTQEGKMCLMLFTTDGKTDLFSLDEQVGRAIQDFFMKLPDMCAVPAGQLIVDQYENLTDSDDEPDSEIDELLIKYNPAFPGNGCTYGTCKKPDIANCPTCQQWFCSEHLPPPGDAQWEKIREDERIPCSKVDCPSEAQSRCRTCKRSWCNLDTFNRIAIF